MVSLVDNLFVSVGSGCLGLDLGLLGFTPDVPLKRAILRFATYVLCKVLKFLRPSIPDFLPSRAAHQSAGVFTSLLQRRVLLLLAYLLAL